MTNDDQTAPEATGTTAAAAANGKKGSSASGLKGFFAGLIGGILALAIAAAALVALWPVLQPMLLSDQARRLAQAEQTITDVQARLTAMERERAAASDALATAQSLAQRVNALEGMPRGAATPSDGKPDSGGNQIDRIKAELVRLDSETQALRRAMPPEGSILRLAEKADSAEKVARDIASQHASAQALLLVVGQLRDAVDRGDPYSAELQATRRVGPDQDSVLATLASGAAKGIARKEVLISRFPALSDEILKAAILPEDGNFWQRSLYKAASIISIRRIDGQGDDTAAIVARAEMALKDGDLAKAVQELTALKDRPMEVAAPWIAAASGRLAADRALSELTAAAAAQTLRSGG